MVPLVWIDGAVTPRESARISALSFGFLYGLGAFETLRWYRDYGLVRLDAHLKRLRKTLDVLGIASPAESLLTRAVEEVIAANGPTMDVAVRLTVAEGEEGTRPIVLAHLRDIPYDSSLYERGASAILVTVNGGALAGHKTTNYAAPLLARRRAQREGFEEAILQDRDGFLLEGAASNLFLVRDERLVTPSLQRPLLPGITRKAVLQLAACEGLTCQERDVRADDLRHADEAFLTNAVAEVLPLTRFERRPIGTGDVGSLTRRLYRAYRRAIQKGDFIE